LPIADLLRSENQGQRPTEPIQFRESSNRQSAIANRQSLKLNPQAISALKE
jgi:hypothetical protein